MTIENTLKIKKIWEDNDVLELEITFSSTKYSFTSSIYTDKSKISQLVIEFSKFVKNINNNEIYDLQIGAFGPKYASGALSTKFNYQSNGKINCEIKMESDYFDFDNGSSANQIELHQVTEPALIQNFISELILMENHVSEEACLRFLD